MTCGWVGDGPKAKWAGAGKLMGREKMKKKKNSGLGYKGEWAKIKNCIGEKLRIEFCFLFQEFEFKSND
jgi:hypothetical protein